MQPVPEPACVALICKHPARSHEGHEQHHDDPAIHALAADHLKIGFTRVLQIRAGSGFGTKGDIDHVQALDKEMEKRPGPGEERGPASCKA